MRAARGFTLIELIMVIVLLAIVATISVQFVTLSAQGALDVSSRQQRALSGVVISEQISRQLREALPTSVRTSTDGSCVEWIPVRAASNYLSLPNGSSPDRFEAVPLANGQSARGRVVVYGYGSNVYSNASPGPLSPPATLPAGPSPVTVTFDDGQPHRFSAQSPERRFYVVGDPLALCQSGRFLYRYENYGFNTAVASALPTSHPGRKVLAANLVPGSLQFEVMPPTLRRGAVIAFRLQLQDESSGETTTLDQEVQVRNVP